MINLERFIFINGALAFILFLLYAFIMVGVIAVTENACVQAGWRTGIVTYTFNQYCSREENEYEITVPLREAVDNERR